MPATCSWTKFQLLFLSLDQLILNIKNPFQSTRPTRENPREQIVSLREQHWACFFEREREREPTSIEWILQHSLSSFPLIISIPMRSDFIHHLFHPIEGWLLLEVGIIRKHFHKSKNTWWLAVGLTCSWYGIVETFLCRGLWFSTSKHIQCFHVICFSLFQFSYCFTYFSCNLNIV